MSIDFAKIQAEKNLSSDQIEEIKAGHEYLKKHKINELFNELLAKTLIDRPDDVRSFLKKELDNIKSNQNNLFFTKIDFESMFQNYDILGKDEVPISYLLQGLDRVGVDMTQETLLNRYKDLKIYLPVRKERFLEIMQMEYRQSNKMKV